MSARRLALPLDPARPDTRLLLALELLDRSGHGADTLVVVPALDVAATTAAVGDLLQGAPTAWSTRVGVESAVAYLERGHDVAIGLRDGLAASVRHLVDLTTTGHHDGPQPTPAQVLADLAHLTRPEPPVSEAPPRVAVPLTDTMLLTTTSWGSKVVLDPTDISLTPDVVLLGHYDPVFVRFLDLTVRPGDTVVDVGANIGLFTLRLAELVGPTGFVHAFEPVEHVRELCLTTLQMNYVTAWCEVDPRAASDQAGTAVIHTSARAQGNSSLVAKTDAYVRAFPLDASTAVTVETVRLDRVLPRRPVRLVKIDVEGAEGLVLDGLTELLDAGLVSTVVIELVKENTAELWPLLVATLERLRSTYGATFSRLDVSGRRVVRPLEALLREQPMPHMVIDLASR